VPHLLEQNPDDSAQLAAASVRLGSQAAIALRHGLPKVRDPAAAGVKIWSGRSADRLEACSSMMPSISESPLEQDFTIEGIPSKLGCPFASMAGKKLSSHAASVLSRYNTNSGGPVTSPSVSSANRVNGRESIYARKASGGDRRSSFVDPIKAEICGLSDHDDESPMSDGAMQNPPAQQESAEPGVCPIRFLDQHSPEEVATYFERHKHELPRSHEVCVKRYQSNEKQIQELDAKYGNLVSMIQGLGAKHKGMLPEEIEEAEDAGERGGDAAEAEKIQRWASSVSALYNDAPQPEDEEERQPHFERPLRDVRVGESPSRPWGIQVPAKYLEAVESETISRPAEPARPAFTQQGTGAETTAKCPFGYTGDRTKAVEPPKTGGVGPHFIAADVVDGSKEVKHEASSSKQPSMAFTGPVFIGYSAEDAAKILRLSGLSGT